MKKIFVLIFFFSTQIFSQDYGYIKGYAITNSYDSLYGYLEIKKGINKTFLNVRFKESENGKVRKYSPYELVGFVTDAATYVSKETTAVRGNREKLFLEVIVSGYLSYYQLETNGYGRQAILEKKDNPNQIFFNTSFQKDPGYAADFRYKELFFKKRIMEFLKDDEEIYNQIKSRELRIEDLEQIVLNYNKNKETK